MTTLHETPQDKALDHLVDTMGISYGEACERLGVELPDNRFFTADRVAARNEDRAYYGTEFNHTGAMPRTPEEQATFVQNRATFLGGNAVEGTVHDTEH